MKKIIKFAGIAFVIFIALLIILPYAFKGKVVDKVKEEVNNSVNAEVDFGTFHLSLLRNFPNLSLRLNDFSVKGVDVFEDITLAETGSIFVTIDIISFFGDEGLEVLSVRFDDLEANLMVLEDGRSNWDIMIPLEETAGEEVEYYAESFEFNLALQNFEIRNGNIVYDDRLFDVYIELANLNHKLRGDFTADFSTISNFYTTADSFTMNIEGIPVFTRVVLDMEADVEMDFSQLHFTLKENELKLNDLALGFDGFFTMPPGEDMYIDLSFSSKSDDIGSFISLIPAIYAHEFESIKTSGDFALDGRINGIMKGEVIPSFNINLLLEDGEFSYPDYPESVSDIQVIANIINEGKYVDQTVIDVSRFSFNVAENPLSVKFKLKTPISDPDFDFDMNCNIDLEAIAKTFPVPDIEDIKGTIEGNMFAKGKLSIIEQGRYSQIKAGGSFDFREIYYQGEGVENPVELVEVIVSLSPRYVELKRANLKYGDSELLAKGLIDNIFGFLFGDQLLSGSFELWANYIDLNQFIAKTPKQLGEEDGGMELSIINLPENIDFTLKTKLDHVMFGDFDVSDIKGIIRLADQQLHMDSLSMNMLDGSITLNGVYETPGADFAEIDLSMHIYRFDIQKSFNSFNTIQILAPMGEYSYGNISTTISLSSQLDDNFKPILKTMNGKGVLSSCGIKLEGPLSMLKVAEGLKMGGFNTLELSDFVVSFTIRDGKLDFDLAGT